MRELPIWIRTKEKVREKIERRRKVKK